jgi:hypothetical protein
MEGRLMAPGPCHSSNEVFRLLHDEENDRYYIQKKRLFCGWKFVDFKSCDKNKAIAKLHKLRAEYKKRRTKKRFVILDA